MATTIGRVDYLVSLDGRNLPAQARKLGNDLGKELGEGTNSSFDKAMSDMGRKIAAQMRENGTIGGHSFTDAMKRIISSDLGSLTDSVARAFKDPEALRRYVDELGGVAEGSMRTRAALADLQKEGVLTSDQFRDLSVQLSKSENGWLSEAEAIRMSATELELVGRARTRELDGLGTELREAHNKKLIEEIGLNSQLEETVRRMEGARINEALGLELDRVAMNKLSEARDVDTESQGRWGASMDGNNKRMSHGARQALFYTGLFASMGNEISVLSSAVGSSVTILASTLLAGGIGIGVGIAAFKNLGAELATLPPAIQPAAAAFQALGANLAAMQDQLELSALKDLAPTFAALGPLIDAMVGPLSIVAVSVGAVATQLVNMLTSAEGMSNLTALITAAGPAFEGLMSAAFNLSGALGDIFVVAIPYTQIFTDYIDNLFTTFNDWTSSIAGQNALVEWFENGLFIMGKVGDLLGATGQALSDLVTPQAVIMTGQLLDNLTEFMPVLGRILSVIGDLNIFGLISELLVEFGKAIDPILPSLSTFAQMLSGVLSRALETLGPILGDLLVGLAPVLNAFLDLAATLIDALLPALGPIMSVIVALLPPFVLLAQALMPIIEIAGQLITALSPILELFAALISVALLPLTLGIQTLAPVLQLLALAFTPVLALLELLTPAIQMATDYLAGIVPALMSGQQASDAFGGALEVLGAIFTWLNDSVIQPVVTAISTAFNWLYANAIKPVSDFIVMVITAVGEAFQFLWSKNIQPIIDFISAAWTAMGVLIQFVQDSFITPILTNIGLLFKGLWKTFIKPALDSIGKAFNDLWNGVIKPVADFIVAVIGLLGSTFQMLWKKNVQPVLDFIGAAFNLLYTSIIQPRIDAMVMLLTWIGESFTDLWNGAGEALGGIGKAFNDLYNGVIKPISDSIMYIVNLVGSAISLAFQGAADGIRGAFEGVASFVRDVFNNISRGINMLIDGINDMGSSLGAALGVDFSSLGRLPMLAAGTITQGPMRAIIGEAGPEAVVPLNRPLGAVAPEVRELSAFAQGKLPNNSAPAKIINFLAGAIIVQTLGDPQQAASAVVDRISEDL